MTWFFSSVNISSLEHWKSSLILITPLEQFRFYEGMFLFLNCEKFSYSVKYLCFLFSVSIIIVPFLKFSTVFGLIFVDMIFCIRNGDRFVNGKSSIDSNIINFGNRGSCQDNYSSRNRKEYRSFLCMTDPTTITL